MQKTTPIPLGYIDLPNGPRAIFPMNDIFLNYAFQSPDNWEVLREAVNILIDAYRQINPSTQLGLITGKIEVRTQFKHMLDGKATRDQDIKMSQEAGDATYIEFQNKSSTNSPIPMRATEYFGLGIGHSHGKAANQIWLLAEDVSAVLFGNTFARYVLKEETKGHMHPTPSGILYVSLQKLSQDSSPAGELASCLLGKTARPTEKKIQNIMTAINNTFGKFKLDKDVMTVYSLRERWHNEGMLVGEARGEEKGKVEIVARLTELIQAGHTGEEALRIISNETPQTHNGEDIVSA